MWAFTCPAWFPREKGRGSVSGIELSLFQLQTNLSFDSMAIQVSIPWWRYVGTTILLCTESVFATWVYYVRVCNPQLLMNPSTSNLFFLPSLLWLSGRCQNIKINDRIEWMQQGGRERGNKSLPSSCGRGAKKWSDASRTQQFLLALDLHIDSFTKTRRI